PENIEVLAAALGTEYEVFFAISGDEAIELTSSQRIDLILLDIMMPEVDGYEVCRLLKLDPELAEIPVIFVTAKTDLEDEAKGFAVGAVDYITKPIKRLTVRARVKTHLELKASRDRLKALANLDTVAGLPNRATFDQVLERETTRAQLEGAPLSLLLLGIDAFDLVAQAQGRSALQRSVEQVGYAAAAKASGPLDLCAHYGGPQFALLLPHADVATASARGAALIDAVAALGLQHGEGAARRPLTASVGGVSADFVLIDPAMRVRPQEMTLLATRALDEAARSGCGQLSLRRWEMQPMGF
ncbi:MAG: response regulator, partial [Gammaproteobacteria bacterium]|nr:response regulator [Gammaproteobacteria bacterium]